MSGRVQNMLKGHGQETGKCVPSDRSPNIKVCEVGSWCPVERDILPAGKDRPMIPGTNSPQRIYHSKFYVTLQTPVVSLEVTYFTDLEE